MNLLYKELLTKRSGEINTDIVERFYSVVEKQKLPNEFLGKVLIVFSELFLNSTHHSRSGTGLKALDLSLEENPVKIYYAIGANRQSILIQNITDELRAEEVMRRTEILSKGDQILGPARHIYKDDPKGHGGRGNGLRDIFTDADIVCYRITKPRSGSLFRHVSALARFNIK